ncbi:hypothetical protein B0O80DRAFT_155053 [Mortierella sp. GBAus27b]|nr:hypothetical protein B0O80DRAFT_155053 [Mortierella sp. GBAus27b]
MEHGSLRDHIVRVALRSIRLSYPSNIRTLQSAIRFCPSFCPDLVRARALLVPGRLPVVDSCPARPRPQGILVGGPSTLHPFLDPTFSDWGWARAQYNQTSWPRVSRYIYRLGCPSCSPWKQLLEGTTQLPFSRSLLAPCSLLQSGMKASSEGLTGIPAVPIIWPQPGITYPAAGLRLACHFQSAPRHLRVKFFRLFLSPFFSSIPARSLARSSPPPRCPLGALVLVSHQPAGT